jgi:protein gp37
MAVRLTTHTRMEAMARVGAEPYSMIARSGGRLSTVGVDLTNVALLLPASASVPQDMVANSLAGLIVLFDCRSRVGHFIELEDAARNLLAEKRRPASGG